VHLEYSGWNALNEWPSGKKESPFLGPGTPSIFFGVALVRQKNHSGAKVSGCPDIAFYDPHHADPGRNSPEPVTIVTATNQQPFRKHARQVSNR
jgi:hypothetical protein